MPAVGRLWPSDDDEDGDGDDDDEEEEDDSEGNDDGVWLTLATIIIIFKTLANGVYGDENDVDTGSVLVTLIMMIMFLISTIMFL